MLENWQLSNLIEQAEKDTEYGIDYHSKVKDRCAWCGTICNKEKKFEYYVRMGNCCEKCSTRIGSKMNNRIRLRNMEEWFRGIVKENEDLSSQRYNS